jgi:MFS family permease
MQTSSAGPAALRRNVYAFGLTSFFNDTASEMAYWVLPAFLVSLGAGPAQLGVIEGIAESVASLAKLYSGHLADRVSRRKPVVITGYLVANAVKPVLAVATSWLHVLVIRFADRLAKGIRGAPRDVMLAESVEKERVGSAFGLLQAMDSAGAIAGPLLALAILAHFSLRGVFWAAIVPGSLSVMVALLGIRETRRGSQEDSPPNTRTEPVGAAGNSDRRPWWKPGLPGPYYRVLAVVTLFSLGNSSDMFLVLRAQNVGISVSHAPLLGLVFNITYTALSWPAGFLSDRLSRRSLVALGYFVFSAVYLVFAAAPSTRVIWIAMAAYGLFYALTNPVLKALIADTVQEEFRGRAFGLFYFATSIATLLASVVAGEMWKSMGASAPFFFSASTALIAALILALAPARTRRLHESPRG